MDIENRRGDFLILKILDKAVCISHCTNTFIKDTDVTIIFPAIG